MLGASLVSLTGLSAGLLHIFNHALAKGTLFLAVMALAMRFGQLDLAGLGGAARRMPWTMSAFVVGALSLIGVPGTAGFVSKWYLVTAAFAEGPLGYFLIAVIVVGSLMAVVYSWRIVEATWFAQEVQADPVTAETSTGEAPLAMLTVVWLAALSNIYFGLFTALPRALAEGAAGALIAGVP